MEFGLTEEQKQIRDAIEKICARFDDGKGLGMTGFGDKKGVFGRPACQAVEHHHRLGGSRSFVEQRGVGNLQPRQIDDHRLIIEQRLQAALRNLSLIGRVLRVPGWIF